MTLRVYFREDVLAILRALDQVPHPANLDIDPTILEVIPDEVKKYYRKQGFAEGYHHALHCAAIAFRSEGG